MTEPRQQPYIFAHLALPGLFFRTPGSMLTNLEENGAEFLRYLWRQIGLEEGQHDEAAGMQIQVTCQPLATGRVALITLPPPERPTEAYRLALCLLPDGARFFTLELGENLDGSLRTVFCEWDANGRHYNHGNGPIAGDESAFLAMTELLLAKSY